MARFFDDIIRDTSALWPELRQLLEESTVILSDNVAEYFYSGTDQNYWSLETDFPNLGPPFEVFFIEWKDPPFLVAHGIGRQRIAERKRSGALFAYAESSAFPDTEMGQNCRWVVNIWLWAEYSRTINLLGSMTIKVGPDGKPVRFSEKGFFTAMLNPEVQVQPQPSAEFLLSLVQPALLTVCFLHCKNITLETHTPPAPVAKKRRMRYGRPPVIYKTLVIEPLKQVLKSEGNADNMGLRKVLHICRGHFKDFRERGLFGKIHGVFWWAEHLAGSLRSGMVRKDYSVVTPRKDDVE